MEKRIYLDHNATTPPDPRVIEAMIPYYTESWGNASSLHQFGRQAKAGLEEAREIIRQLVAEFPESDEYVSYLGLLGVIAARMGDSTEASTISNQLSELRTPYLNGRHTRWRARIAALLGQPDDAMRLLRESLHQGLAYGTWLHSDMDLDSLRDRSDFQELMRPKG